MADKDFNSVEDLVDFVNNDFENIMLTKVSEKIKDVEQDVIDDVVYGWGNPVKYIRRYDNGGLYDRYNMDSYLEKNGDETVLIVENDTKVSPYTYDSERGTYLDEIIENGNGTAEPYNRPRPFTERTQDIIDSNGIVEKTIKNSLDYVE